MLSDCFSGDNYFAAPTMYSTVSVLLVVFLSLWIFQPPWVLLLVGGVDSLSSAFSNVL